MTVPQAGVAEQDPRSSGWRRAVIEEVLAVLDCALAKVDLTDPAQAEFSHIERTVQMVLRQVGGIVAAGWAQAAADVQANRPFCPQCQGAMAIGHRTVVTKTGLVGTSRLERVEYVCTGCGDRATPAETLWKLGPGELSPELSRVASAAAAEIPSFARAAQTVGEVLGITLSVSTVERTAEALGAVAEAEIQAQVAEVLSREGYTCDPGTENAPTAPASCLPDDAPTLLVGVDGARVFADKDWREVKVGVVCELGPERHHDPRTGRDPLVLGPRQYVAGVEAADPFFARLTTVVDPMRDRLGQAVRILAIGDGGSWIWPRSAFVAGPDDEVVEILDFFHATEHLGDLAKAMHWEDKAAEAWVKRLADHLRDEGPDSVIEELSSMRPRGKEQRKIRKQKLKYFEDNATRMDYPTYAARGWPLGSGIVESTCRLVSNLRTKGPGCAGLTAACRRSSRCAHSACPPMIRGTTSLPPRPKPDVRPSVPLPTLPPRPPGPPERHPGM